MAANLASSLDVPTIHRQYDWKVDTEQVEIDNRLGERIAKGDELAFSAFHRRWWGYALNYVKGRMYYHDHHDSEEVTSDIFQSIWELTTEGEWEYGAYVQFFHAILKRRAAWRSANLTRRRRCRIVRENEWFYTTSRASDMEREVENDTLSDAISEALLMLTPKQRLAFILHYREGYTQSETGRILGLKPRMAQKHLQNVRDRLREMLADWR